MKNTLKVLGLVVLVIAFVFTACNNVGGGVGGGPKPPAAPTDPVAKPPTVNGGNAIAINIAHNAAIGDINIPIVISNPSTESIVITSIQFASRGAANAVSMNAFGTNNIIAMVAGGTAPQGVTSTGITGAQFGSTAGLLGQEMNLTVAAETNVHFRIQNAAIITLAAANIDQKVENFLLVNFSYGDKFGGGTQISIPVTVTGGKGTRAWGASPPAVAVPTFAGTAHAATPTIVVAAKTATPKYRYRIAEVPTSGTVTFTGAWIELTVGATNTISNLTAGPPEVLLRNATTYNIEFQVEGDELFSVCL